VFISAGFDAHSKDAIQGPVNLGVKELDYEWLTNELCEIANKHAGGRVISVLEGGYRIQGKAVSAFGRSVASHCKALFATHNTDCFDEKLNARILEKEVAKKREQRELVRLERLERETEQLRRRQEERERELLRLQELEENGDVEAEEGGAPTEAAEAAAPPPAEVQEVGGKTSSSRWCGRLRRPQRENAGRATARTETKRRRSRRTRAAGGSHRY